EYLEVLVAGINGIDCVLSGLVVTGGADMTPAVAKGAVLSNGTLFAVAAADVTITAADATNPRFDLIVVTSAGALAVRAGTPAAAPKPPARTANDVVISVVYVPANDTAIGTSQCIDMRVLRTQGPITIYKTTTAETTNTTAAAIEALNKANSGVTIPSGLFLAGRILRVRLHGNMLLNNTTPTVRVAILYGGSTLFSDISAAAVNSATRRAWWIDFDVVAQANADQALGGHGQLMDPTVAPVAPTTGIGDIWGINTAAQEIQTPIQGSAAVDSDAANRLLSVQITFSVSNAANELVVEGATVELV
ncbi:MAG: hypothetical protein ACREIB_01510, partial [Pseudomonadota bacterium]